MQSLGLILSKLRYFAPAWVFASLNILVGTWVLYIPTMKTKLAIDDAQLGVALFCFALGTLLMIPLAPSVSRWLGLGKATLISVVLLSCVFLLPLIAPNYILFCVFLFITGLMCCLTDINMNALVSEIEQVDNIHFMSASHGFFSLGGFLAASVGSLVINLIEIPLMHMLYAAVIVVLSNILVSKAYLRISGGETNGNSDIKAKEKKSFKFSLLKPLLGLTVISFLVMGSEGAIEHWSKLYLKDIVSISSEKISGYGFVAFSATMALGRFFGDEVSKRFGPLMIIIGGCSISIIGFIAILSAQQFYSIFGFGLVGLGFSVIVPELFRLAGRAKGVSAAEGISFVAGFGYVGFLLSPALLGFLSRIGTLKLSFTALLVATIVVFITAIILKQRQKKSR